MSGMTYILYGMPLFCASSEENGVGVYARHHWRSAATPRSKASSQGEQRGKWCGRLRTAPLEERRDTEKQSFESGRAAIPGEKIEMRRKAQMRGSYEFTEQFYKSN